MTLPASTLLIVDDDLSNLESLQRIFERGDRGAGRQFDDAVTVHVERC